MGTDYDAHIVYNVCELSKLQPTANRRVFLQYKRGPSHDADLVRLSEENVSHIHYNHGAIHIWFRRMYEKCAYDYIWMDGTLDEFKILRTYLKNNFSRTPTFDSNTLVVFGDYIVCILPNEECTEESIVHLLYTTIKVLLDISALQDIQNNLLVYVKSAEVTSKAMLFTKSIRILEVVGETLFISTTQNMRAVELVVDPLCTNINDVLGDIGFLPYDADGLGGGPRPHTELLSAKNINIFNTTADGFFALYINYTDIYNIRERCGDRYVFSYGDGVAIEYTRSLSTFDGRRCVLDLVSEMANRQKRRASLIEGE
jgi:hypothetical protein